MKLLIVPTAKVLTLIYSDDTPRHARASSEDRSFFEDFVPQAPVAGLVQDLRGVVN